jgi:hypothetical protein
VIADRRELVEIAAEQKFHSGPMELGYLVQEPHIDLRNFVYPQIVTRRRAVQNMSPDPVVGSDPTGSPGSSVSLRYHVHSLPGTPEPLRDALDVVGLPCPSYAQDQQTLSPKHGFFRFDFAQVLPDHGGLRGLGFSLGQPWV